MHDNTNIKLVKLITTYKQWSIYSKYYAQCCVKRGVAVQLSNWVRTLQLFTGGIDDSKITEQSKIFKQQQLFQELDTEPTTSPIQVINIFDKGCRWTFYLEITIKAAYSQLLLCPMNNSLEAKFYTMRTITYYYFRKAIRLGVFIKPVF